MNNSTTSSENDSKKLGLWASVFMIMGCIIGSGIFITPKSIVSSVNSVGMSIVIWIISGVLSILGALLYAELSIIMPYSGGDIYYAKKMFGDPFGFIQLWVNIIISKPTILSIVAMTFSEYVAKPFYMSCNYPTPPESYKSILAILSLFVITFINCASIVWAKNFQNVFTISKLGALVTIIMAGIYSVIFHDGFTNFSEPFAGTTTNVNNIVNALYGSMFAYIGWNFLNLVTQDMQKPSRDSPKAIFIATISVIVIYLLVIISYHTVLNIPEIVSSSAIAINFANKINKYYSYIIPIFVSLSTFGGLNGNFFTSVRLFVEGAHCGYLPKVLAMKHYSERTPIISNIVISIISIFMILSGSIDKLISMFCLLFWLSVEMSVVALLKYRWIHRNEQTNLLRIPIIFHFIFFICAIFMIAIPLYSFDMVSVIVIGVIVLGFLFYVIFIKYKKFHCDKLMVSITLLLQKLLMVTYIDDEEKVGTFELHLKK